jgi:putative DNA primase/helicase
MPSNTEPVKGNSVYKLWTINELVDHEPAWPNGIDPLIAKIESEPNDEPDETLDDVFGQEDPWPVGEEFWHPQFGSGRVVDYDAETTAVAIEWTSEPPGAPTWAYTLDIIKPMIGRAGKYLYDQQRAEEAAQPKESKAKAQSSASSHYSYPDAINIIRASDVLQKPVEWIWENRLARGKQALIGGDPGVGKSQIVLDIVARITRGSPWPDGGKAPLGNCIVLSAEDAANDTICPRLDAAGADLDKVHILQSVNEGGKSRAFSLAHDLVALAAVVREIGDVVLIMVDPITAYLGTDLDSHRTTSVRAILEPLDKFADTYRCCVVCITHPPKAAQSKAINSFTGSLAFVADARTAFVAIDEPETSRHLFLPVKNNIGPQANGLGYFRESCRTQKGIQTSRIRWDGAPVKLTANQAMNAGSGLKGEAMQEALAFLEGYLENGAMSADKVKEAADANDISERTLRRARETLKVVVEKDGFKGGWVWRLPT